MTNQEDFKRDTTELYNLLKKYKRNYSFMAGSRMLQSPVELLESHLRIALEIVRTDEENKAQHQQDCMC